MMMLDKTIEQLKKELHSARASVSYHKNKNKPDKRQKGESPQAKANRLAGNKAWNDNKRAMAHVIALLTANDADYKDAYTQAFLMPVDDARELTKGHEAAVEKQVKVLQEARKVREEKIAVGEMIDSWIVEPKPESKPKPKLTPKPEPVQTVPVCVPLEDAKKVSIPIKRELLGLAQNVVLAATGFEDLSKEQVVGYILNRYLKYNKER
jgi:ribosomal protein L19E